MISIKEYRLPAEWEQQSGVQLTWPHEQTDWACMMDDVLCTYEMMASEIKRHENLLVVGPPSNDTWARDHGFITLVPQAYPEEDSELLPKLLLDFKFNGWGEKFPAEIDNTLNRRIYDEGALDGTYIDHLDFVLEGGSIESDGQGTIFTTTSCLLAPHRNQPLERDEIEQRLKTWLCAERVLWIDHGHLVGDDTDGHIDTLVRIAPDDTLLYVGCDDTADEHYECLRLMELQLMSFRTASGKPYRLMKLPLPQPVFDPLNAERLPATYANFLVINGAVLCPTYGQPDLDAKAMDIIGQAFPGREIVGIDCRCLVRQHGSLHCCTMQFPLGVIKQ